jgi:hypothetical protein
MIPDEDPQEVRWAAERRECYLRMRKAVENLRAGRQQAVIRYLVALKNRHGRELALRVQAQLIDLVKKWGPREHWKC